MPSDTEKLAALRHELDAVDERLLATIRDRVALCVEVARLKDHHDIPMMQSGRVKTVLDRAGRYGEDHGLDPNFLRQLYEQIIEETCRVETEVMRGETNAVGVPKVSR